MTIDANLLTGLEVGVGAGALVGFIMGLLVFFILKPSLERRT
jgi:uncharacterized membrane protein (Fun14 family)